MTTTAPSPRFRLFSVDDHLIEPPGVWADRLPARFRDQGPHVVEDDGREFWVYENERAPTMGLNAVAGKPPTEWGVDPIRYADMIESCYDPVARARDFAADGIMGSVVFPTLPGFGGRLFVSFADKELADLCVKAYNDWIIDEWCAAAPELYVPTIICQLWDPPAAAAEVRRCAALGARSVAFPENTYPLGLPSLHQPSWDPFWSAVEETQTVVSMHLGASGRGPSASPESNFASTIIWGSLTMGGEAVTELMLGRVTRQFPDIDFVVTEGGIGYLPYLIERADYVWNLHRYWAGLDDIPPSEIFARSIYVCSVHEDFGLRNRDLIGVDHILWESDFPHSETTWPNSQRLAEEAFDGIPDAEVDLITHQNAQRLFRFPG